ncbi:MAG: hypothetical protein AAF726_01380 [Planctomycetota bacterium]
MKTVTLHVPSLLVGAAVGIGLLLSLGAAPQRPASAVSISSAAGPAARDLVWLEGGGLSPATYVVPTGKILVLERLTWSTRATPVRVAIDGVFREWTVQSSNGLGITEQRYGNGVPLPAGTTVSVDAPPGGHAWLLGFLADA